MSCEYTVTQTFVWVLELVLLYAVPTIGTLLTDKNRVKWVMHWIAVIALQAVSPIFRIVLGCTLTTFLIFAVNILLVFKLTNAHKKIALEITDFVIQQGQAIYTRLKTKAIAVAQQYGLLPKEEKIIAQNDLSVNAK